MHLGYVFLEIIDKLHNDCFPLNKVKLNVKHQNKPWITPIILKSIRKKNNMYKHMRQNNNIEFKNKYKLYKK